MWRIARIQTNNVDDQSWVLRNPRTRWERWCARRNHRLIRYYYPKRQYRLIGDWYLVRYASKGELPVGSADGPRLDSMPYWTGPRKRRR
jgi:hypothetical protein